MSLRTYALVVCCVVQVLSSMLTTTAQANAQAAFGIWRRQVLSSMAWALAWRSAARRTQGHPPKWTEFSAPSVFKIYSYAYRKYQKSKNPW